jgi:hypothetical protein
MSSEIVLTQYVIYDRPSDFPDCYVVRPWHVIRGSSEPVPSPFVMLAASLERARRRVPRGLVCIPRQPGDDRTIVEVWT